MDSLPPPQIPPSSPPAEPGRSRLVIGGVAALAAVVVAGGLVVGSQFVSADRASIVTTSATAPGDDAPAGEDETGDDESDTADTGGTADDDNADWTEFDRCLSEQLGIDLSTETEDGELDLDQVEAAEEACSDLFPADLEAGFEAFEAFEQCLDEQLGGVLGNVLGEGGQLNAEGWNGSVVVENLGGDGEEALTVVDFGPGDATVVVTKSGDTISVDTTGDVTTLDKTFFEAEKAEWEAAEQACANLLPEGLDVFDMEFGDFEFGDMDFGELDFGELGGILEELPFEEMLDEGMLGEFEMMFDEDMLSEIKDMFESGEFGDFEQLFDDKVDASPGSDTTD